MLPPGPLVALLAVSLLPLLALRAHADVSVAAAVVVVSLEATPADATAATTPTAAAATTETPCVIRVAAVRTAFLGANTFRPALGSGVSGATAAAAAGTSGAMAFTPVAPVAVCFRCSSKAYGGTSAQRPASSSGERQCLARNDQP